jgi:phage-related protein
VAQRGGKHRDAKVLTGFGEAGVLEVVEDFRGDTFRAVYTLKYPDSVYVLHRVSEEILRD